jgi:PAS domain S-box-containing protein
VRALDRLGRDATVEVLHDAASCCELVARETLDLVILEERVGEGDAHEVLAALRADGPPVIVVTSELDEEIAVDVFRRGAADCIAATSDYAEVLPVVTLEQIRRWRAARERGDAERRIRWLEHLHEAIVNEIPAALVVLDGHGNVVTVNPEFSRIWGVSAGEVNGRSLERVLPLDLLESGGVGELLSRAAQGRSLAPRIARVTDGERGIRAFDIRAKRLGEGRLLLVLSDLTEVEHLAKQVDDLQRYNENIIQNMNSALLVVDLEGEITYANPTAERILDTPPGGLRGRPVWDWFPGTPREEVLISRTLKENMRFRGAETVITRASGSMVPIGISGPWRSSRISPRSSSFSARCSRRRRWRPSGSWLPESLTRSTIRWASSTPTSVRCPSTWMTWPGSGTRWRRCARRCRSCTSGGSGRVDPRSGRRRAFPRRSSTLRANWASSSTRSRRTF